MPCSAPSKKNNSGRSDSDDRHVAIQGYERANQPENIGVSPRPATRSKARRSAQESRENQNAFANHIWGDESLARPQRPDQDRANYSLDALLLTSPRILFPSGPVSRPANRSRIALERLWGFHGYSALHCFVCQVSARSFHVTAAPTKPAVPRMYGSNTRPMPQSPSRGPNQRMRRSNGAGSAGRCAIWKRLSARRSDLTAVAGPLPVLQEWTEVRYAEDRLQRLRLEGHP